MISICFVMSVNAVAANCQKTTAPILKNTHQGLNVLTMSKWKISVILRYIFVLNIIIIRCCYNITLCRHLWRPKPNCQAISKWCWKKVKYSYNIAVLICIQERLLVTEKYFKLLSIERMKYFCHFCVTSDTITQYCYVEKMTHWGMLTTHKVRHYILSPSPSFALYFSFSHTHSLS